MTDILIGVVLLLMYLGIGFIIDMVISGTDEKHNPTVVIFWPVFVLTMLIALIIMMPIALIDVLKDKLKR